MSASYEESVRLRLRQALGNGALLGFERFADVIADIATPPEILEPAVSPIRYGAAGDGVTNDTAALLSALNSGRIVDGGGRTYAFSGTITVARADLVLRNITLRQISSSAVLGLHVENSPRARLEYVTVDGGGFSPAGGMGQCAPLRISTSAGATLAGCRVTNFGKQTGCLIRNSRLARANVRIDSGYTLEGAQPTDDVLQGLWFDNCEMFVAQGCVITDLTSDWPSRPSPYRRWSRGIVVGGSSSGTISDCLVELVEQGIDITGTLGNDAMNVTDNQVLDAGTWGIKIANSGRRNQVAGNVIKRVGYAGIVVSGMTDVANPIPGDDTIVNNLVLETGSSGLWSGSDTAGILILANATVDATYPRGTLVRGNRTISTGTGMRYGARCEVVPQAGTAETNWLFDHWSEGHVIAPQLGFSMPSSIIAGESGSSQSVANDTWATVALRGTEPYDPAEQHVLASDAAITAKLPGIYIVMVNGAFPANGTGLRQVRVQRNGGNFNWNTSGQIPGTAGEETRVDFSCPVIVTAPGTNITVDVRQTSGASMNIDRGRWHLALIYTGHMPT